MKKFGFLLFLAGVAIFYGNETIAQSKTTKYTYDSLGRLTFVEDGVNGNRDYDYDKAGNRLLVSTNSQNDAATEPGSSGGSLPAPTGLSYAPCCSMGIYKVSWNAVAGATHYIYTLTDGSQKTVTTTTDYTQYSSNSSVKPNWVKACNATSCSFPANF